MKPKQLFKKIKIGSRPSFLAVQQVKEVLGLLSAQGIQLEYEHVLYDTQGDKDKKTALCLEEENVSSPVGFSMDDFFTDTLDQALMNGEIDVSVHSAKDVPQNLNPKLQIYALTECLDETDSLIAHARLADLKPGAKIGTSSAIRRDAIQVINPNVETISIRGTIEERIKLFQSGQYDGIIVATCALKRLGLENLICEVMLWEAAALQGQLAVVGRIEDNELRELISVIDVRQRYGKVILVGAGPGDPELITQKGIKALEKADCVFYDYLIDQRLLVHAVQAEKIFVGKRKGQHTLPQAELSRMLRAKAVQGKNVVRLKGGDPLIFGRGAEEIQYLSSYHIPVEVVPGVSSATGIPSNLGVPLTARGVSSSVAFLSGHEGGEINDKHKFFKIPSVETIVFLMGLTSLPSIVESLQKAGWALDTPAMVISKGTTREEKIITATIQTIESSVLNGNLNAPALIIVGKTVNFFKPKTVSNKNEQEIPETNILYLGTNPQKYESFGPILHWPLIEITPIIFSEEQKREILSSINQYDWIILTSRFAVQYFMELIGELKYSLRNSQIKWAVIGRETARALRNYGIIPTLIPELETSQGLFKALTSQFDLKGKKMLFPRSALPNPYLKNELTKTGVQVTELIVYENKKPVVSKRPDLSQVNSVIFTSPSTVKNFLDLCGAVPQNWKIFSKGTLTQETLKNAGYESEILIDEEI